jgi:hypothetical protein
MQKQLPIAAATLELLPIKFREFGVSYSRRIIAEGPGRETVVRI